MGELSGVLREMGFVPTEEESPVDKSGQLWANNHELVCDETGIVIDGNHHVDENDDEVVYRYPNSGNVILPGGYSGPFSIE